MIYRHYFKLCFGKPSNFVRKLVIIIFVSFSPYLVICSCSKETVDESLITTPTNHCDPFFLKVMTYNIGDFSGIGFENGAEEGIFILRKAISEQRADIIGLQEDVEFYGDENPRDVIYPMYNYYYRTGSTHYNYKGFASLYPISNVIPVYYSPNSIKYGHPYFLTGELNIYDKTILLVSFHFDWADKSRRRRQIDQLISYARKYKYVIFMGDTNCENYDEGVLIDSALLYEEEWELFAKAGYKMASGGLYGIIPTTANNKPIDNIFVSDNVFIRYASNAIYDYMNDHYMLWADLVIY